jgi:hypothetical protein
MRPSAAPNDASEDLRISAGKAAGQHRECRKQDTGSDSFAADDPDAAQPAAVWAISAQIARKMGAGFEAADLGVRCGPCMARILEPGTLNSLEFFQPLNLVWT